MLASLRFTLTEHYRATQIGKIRQLNDNLCKIVNGTLPFYMSVGNNLDALAVGGKANFASQDFQRVQEYAQALHCGLEENLELSMGCNVSKRAPPI